MFNVGFPEMLVIAFLGLIVFGPERLPELARNAAKLITRFRTEASRSIADLKEAADLGDLDAELREIRQELKAAKGELNRAVNEPASTLRQLGKDVSSGGPSTHTPTAAASLAPPIDPEAT